MDRSYSGMNAEYYVGMETCFYPLPDNHAPPAFKAAYEVEGASPSSGSSSNTTTQLEDELQLADALATHATAFGVLASALDRPLPIRKRQRKPMKKSRPTEAEVENIPAHKKPGRKPKATAVAVGVSQAQPLKELERKMSAKEALSPRFSRDLPARHTPKKLWEEDEIVGGVRKGRVARQNMADLEDYTPTPSPRKVKVAAPKQPRQNPPAAPHGSPCGSPRPSGGPKGQKEGGPCAVCFATKSATWRRGAQGGRHSGEPLCNKCGVWEFRHPDSPPRDEALDLDRTGFGRRGSTGSAAGRRLVGQNRGLLHQPLSHDEAKALPHQPQPRAFPHQPLLARAGSDQPSADSLPESSPMARSASVPFSPAAVAPAAPGVGPFSRMQPWTGNNLVARVPDTAQLSTMQRWAAGPSMLRTSSGPAASPMTEAADTTATAHAATKKRSADGSSAEPEAKRWQTDASTSSSSRNMWAIANAARLSHASNRADEGQREEGKATTGLMGLQGQQTRIKLKVVRSKTTPEQEPRVKEEFEAA